MNLGKEIKNRREQKKISQEKIANQLHISRQTLSKWELGKSFPDFESLTRLAILFDFSLDEVFELPTERERNMKYYTENRLIDDVQKRVGDVTLENLTQRKFISENLVQPLMEMNKDKKIYYFITQKQLLSIFVSQPINSVKSKEYLDIFSNDCSDYWFITDKGIIYFNVISFFEDNSMSFYPYAKVEYICVGRQYQTIDIRKNNPPVLGIFLNDKSYNWALIAEDDISNLLFIFEHLCESNNLLLELTKYSLMTFIKKWRKNHLIKI